MEKILLKEYGGGHHWENIAPDPIFSSVVFHVLCAYRSVLGPEWCTGNLRTHYDRLYFVESGSALLYFEDESIKLRPGFLYLIPANELHRHSCDRRVTISWCHFQAQATGGIDLLEILRAPRHLAAPDFSSTQETYAELIQSMEIESGWGMVQRASLLVNLLMPFLQITDENSYKAIHARYNPVFEYIDDHLGGEISLEMLAHQIGLSTEHFCRCFSRDFHTSPMRYVLQKRIQLAQRLLCQTDWRHQQIGEQCGFPDPFHFSKAFKRQTGLSATEYRKRYQ